ncbi:PAS domain S-box protein, partial [bacterium]|nr:PAS domain S-box protein [bacterium]
FREALSKKPDLILVDYSVPSFNGLAALEVRRKLAAYIPSIVVSGTIGEEAAVECMKVGATDYVLKDRLFRLVTVVKRALKEAEGHKKLLQAEEEIRILSQAVNSSIDGFAMSDLNGKISYVNKAFTEMFGYLEEELIGKEIAFIYPEKQIPLLKKAVKSVMEYNWSGESIGKKKNGELFPIEIFASRVLDDKGAVIAFLGNHRDITERKHAEERSVYQSRMRELLMKLSSAYINVPLEKVNQSINESLREVGEFVAADRAYIFEYDWGAGVTNNTFEWCREGVSPQIENLQGVPLDGIPEWTETHRQGKPMDVPDVSSLPEDGSLRQILEPQEIKSLITISLMKEKECTGFIGFDSIKKNHAYSENEEKLLNIFAEIIMNITDRKRAEEQLKEYAENLERMVKERTKALDRALYDTEQAREKVDGILKAITDGLIVTDRYDRVVLMNSAVEDLLEVRLTEAIGRPIDFAIRDETLKARLKTALEKK